jgi:signal transduction histidine kinase
MATNELLPKASATPPPRPQGERREDGPRYKRRRMLAKSSREAVLGMLQHVDAALQALWHSQRAARWREQSSRWTQDTTAGVYILVGGMAGLTLLIALIDRFAPLALPSPGLIYLPLVAMLAYHWGWRHAVAAGILELVCVYVLFIPPAAGLKPLDPRMLEQLLTLAVVTGFVLALVQLARTRREMVAREAERFAALNSVGTALAQELDEQRLLYLIAQTARSLTGAEFAAFTLRPTDALGQPVGPSEGSLFHLAAVVGVTPEQEALFRRMPLGGEGLLAPIFRHGTAVRVGDALALETPMHGAQFASMVDAHASERHTALSAASAHEPGLASPEALRSMGVPRGHPIVRSFLGAPLLDREGGVRGGLLLGHSRPDRFTADNESLLTGLAAQASVALENARLYHAARTQAQELDAIFESIADGVILVDKHGAILRENAAARRLREDLIEDLIEENGGETGTKALLRAPAEQALKGETTDGVSISLADCYGQARSFLLSASPLRASAQTDPLDVRPSADSPAVSGAVIVWHDVTESRRLEEEQRTRAEIEARRALLQMVIDELPSGVYLVHGPEARLVLANRAAVAVWGAEWPRGLPMAAFLASAGVRIQSAAGSALAAEELATLRTARTGELIRHFQEVIRRPDGASLPVLLNAVALDAGMVSGSDLAPSGAKPSSGGRAALVVLQDVTALKDAERLKDEFIAIAAHELRNPMAAIKGYAQMLTGKRSHGTALEEWQVEAIETIDSATSRLVELTDDLLDVTRLQAGRLELHPEPADLVALARRVVKRQRIAAPHHHLVVTADDDFIVAQIDPQRTEQVLGNLLGNAIKYSPDGGEVRVTLRQLPDQHMAELSIQDQGIGIPSDQQAHIFGRFIRAANAKEHGIGGTGLGLYLCRELVERHGGRIWFESSESHGSTFHITLPLAPDDLTESSA